MGSPLQDEISPGLRSPEGPFETDFVWFEGQDLKYKDSFRELVEERLVTMSKYDGGEIDHRFLGFLKDELVKLNKITDLRTRMTFANDMISLVAFRMKFGALLSALMTNFEVTGFAIGLNQYSHDMENIYRYLTRVSKRFVAGDYKEFDMRFVKKIEIAGYKVFCDLAKHSYGVDDNSCAYLVEHETNSPIQIKDKLCKVYCSNKSGNFLTTIINNFANNFYMRYIFKTFYKHLVFDKCIRLVVLGDDHSGCQR